VEAQVTLPRGGGGGGGGGTFWAGPSEDWRAEVLWKLTSPVAVVEHTGVDEPFMGRYPTEPQEAAPLLITPWQRGPHVVAFPMSTMTPAVGVTNARESRVAGGGARMVKLALRASADTATGLEYVS
jgi:hypothetical protein